MRAIERTHELRRGGEAACFSIEHEAMFRARSRASEVFFDVIAWTDVCQ